MKAPIKPHTCEPFPDEVSGIEIKGDKEKCPACAQRELVEYIQSEAAMSLWESGMSLVLTFVATAGWREVRKAVGLEP